MIRSNRKPLTTEVFDRLERPAHLNYVVDVKYQTIQQRIARLRRDIPESNTFSPKNYANHRPNIVPSELKRSIVRSHSSQLMGSIARSPTHQIQKRSRPNFELLNCKKSTQALRKWKYGDYTNNPTPSQVIRDILRHSESQTPNRNPEDESSKYNELVEDMDRMKSQGEGHSMQLQLQSETRERTAGNTFEKSERTDKNSSGRPYDKEEFKSFEDNNVASQDKQLGVSRIRKLPIHLLMSRP